jgi:hypothetical protein
MVYAPGMVYLPTKLGDFAIDPRNPTKVCRQPDLCQIYVWLVVAATTPLKWLMYGYYMVNDG